MGKNGTNISADVVQTAASWINMPSNCISEMNCILNQFDSLFSLQGYTTSEGECLLIAEETEIKTGVPRWKRINELCKSIRVAEKALSLCEKKSPDVFKIDPQWQISFSNLRQQLIERSLPFKVPRVKKSPATIDELAEASTSFVGIVKPLIDLLTLWALKSKPGQQTADMVTVKQVVERLRVVDIAVAAQTLNNRYKDSWGQHHGTRGRARIWDWIQIRPIIEQQFGVSFSDD